MVPRGGPLGGLGAEVEACLPRSVEGAAEVIGGLLVGASDLRVRAPPLI